MLSRRRELLHTDTRPCNPNRQNQRWARFRCISSQRRRSNRMPKQQPISSIPIISSGSTDGLSRRAVERHEIAAQLLSRYLAANPNAANSLLRREGDIQLGEDGHYGRMRTGHLGFRNFCASRTRLACRLVH